MKPKKRKPAQPITAHPLFPALVALWFGALFGLGSFAVPASVLERIVAMTGLPALVPAAAPPLGATAHALVAIMLTVVGLGLGALIGLRLRPASPHASPRRRSVVPDAPAESTGRAAWRDVEVPVCQPLILSEDIAAEPIAPAPAEDAPYDDVYSADPVAEAEQAEPTDYAEFVAVDEGEAAFEAELEAQPFDQPETAADAMADDADEIEQAEVETVAAAPARPTMAPIFAMPEPVVPGAPRSPVAEAPLGTLGLVQLIERLALAIAERRALQEQAQELAQAQAMAQPQDEAFAPAIETRPAPEMVVPPVAEPVDDAEPETAADLAPFSQPARALFRSPLFDQARSGPLAMRLGASPAPDVTVRGEEDEPTTPASDRAEGIQPLPYSPLVQKPIQRIVSLRSQEADIAPVTQDDEDEEEVIVPRFLGRTPLQPVAIPQSDDAEPEPPVPEERYPSLVDMPAPLPRQEFVRVDLPLDALAADAPETDGVAEDDMTEVEPVVVFPGQGPFARPQATGEAPRQIFTPPAAPQVDPEEADRALRAALATLQRMTAKG
ncbi:hypothetical protein [Novosphingobium cyanobacteriorum]|uniref:Uncharacterized protein n=1 Tax=Novosphingobium cyanobacteriorum TaxID=3024215 RepID=A0ABT6CH79_9SPHN|nr:hypothetical protein [Novosphingobium cyanobacteriorum]MDF8333136.1 hypothetical protein [Novosphingobium cyanobacteriorum]